MTEIERIKSEGWLPESFWEEEVRDDFTVTAERKKIWAINLDLFREFSRVCEKHSLRYFAAYGTLLGVIRHNNRFIPWDDDMDVLMPRKDYDVLKTLSAEFKHPYFLQTPETDPAYGYSFMKLRNSNTTALSKKFINNPFNQGFSFDVFPFENVTEEDYVPRRERALKLIMQGAAGMKTLCTNPEARDLEAIEKYHNPNESFAECFRKLEAIAGEKTDVDTPLRGAITVQMSKAEKNVFPKEVFDDYELRSFEGLPMRIPIGWECFLKTHYGDYMVFPPVEKRGAWHDGAVFLPEVPYKEYIAQAMKG